MTRRPTQINGKGEYVEKCEPSVPGAAVGSLVTHHSSRVTAFLINGSAIRSSRKVLKT